jgi:lysophospholipase L1-like esterase
MAYQPRVKKVLADEAVVVGPGENCQSSVYLLAHLDQWLLELGSPDVAHWNCGLHDAGYNPHRKPMQIPLERYVENVRAIHEKLKATGARLVWATTTPVHPHRPLTPTHWSWKNADINRYNAAVLDLMRAEHVRVNDLHAVVASDYDGYMAEDQLHLTPAGAQACADAVVGVVRVALSQRAEGV